MIKLTDEGKAWMRVLTIIRRAIRTRLNRKQTLSEQRNLLRREAKKLIAGGNRFDARRAETLDVKAEALLDHNRQLNTMLIEAGTLLMQSAKSIDAEIPQAVMLDFLEINKADRHHVKPDDGFINLTFVKALEQSAFYRGSDWTNGPFNTCLTTMMQHDLMTNDQLQEEADKILFGKGGMFEFLPTYKQAANGEMIRQRPPLRLV